MHRIIRTKAYEAKHGPHFDDEHARKAVSKMENEDGSKGQHWSLEETSALANQYGIRFDDKFNKYDWYVALNMVYSDYYRVIVNMTGSNNAKYFVELAKAWLCDKDIDEGKMWYYYIYIMCDKIREAEDELFDRNYSRYEDDDDDEAYGNFRRGGRMGRSSYGRRREYDREYDERDYEKEKMFPYEDELKRGRFYNTQQTLFPFGPFNPFFFGRRRRRLNTISGIPVLKTTGIAATTTEVRYDVNHQEFLSLPNEGLFFLDVRQASATADASLPVGLSDDNAENNTTQSMLRNALQEEVQAGDLQLNFRYLIYYNKCNNTYQLVNAYPTNIAAQAA